MAGPLGVSHLLLFSRSATGNTNLRIALTPRGPTLYFRVEKYSLCKDIRKAMKHPKGGGKEHLTPPLLVMNNFTSPAPAEGKQPAIPKHLESLTTTMFQSLFPPISPQTTPLSSIRRVLLLNRELPKPSSSTASTPSNGDGTYTINLRQYAIVTKRVGLPRSIRRINAAEKMLKEGKNRRGLPNLGKLEDIGDYLLDPGAGGEGFTSGSETEVETDAEVEVQATTARKVLNKKQLDAYRRRESKAPERATPGVEKRAVKLVELGPRLKLRMTKVEEGVCGGKVMWHEHVSKTAEEVRLMDRTWDARRKEKEERKRVQKENVERKRKESGAAGGAGEKGAGDEDLMDEDGWDSEEFEAEDGDGMEVPAG
jgi:ribosome biogenesis protein SSF1/2